MKKTFLVLSNSDLGLIHFRKELLQKLGEYGDVVISVPDGGNCKELEDVGCEVIDTAIDRRGTNLRAELNLFRSYKKMIHEIRPDLVLSYTIKPNLYGGIAARLEKVPYVANVTGLGSVFQKRGLLFQAVRVLYRVALKKAKTVFFENSTDRKTFLDEHICTEKQAYLLKGAGVNLSKFAYSEYPSDDSCVRFLFCGRVMKEKGIDELLEASAKLHNENYPFALDVLGSYEENYYDVLETHQEQGWLNFLGYQYDVRPYIYRSHCFVLPSWHEGMANTNLECAAAGRPLITSDIPGCREAVIDEQSGFLCQPQNAESLYLCMKRFLELSHEQKEAMGIAGRKHMEEEFDKRKVVEETVKGLGL